MSLLLRIWFIIEVFPAPKAEKMATVAGVFMLTSCLTTVRENTWLSM